MCKLKNRNGDRNIRYPIEVYDNHSTTARRGKSLRNKECYNIIKIRGAYPEELYSSRLIFVQWVLNMN